MYLQQLWPFSFSAQLRVLLHGSAAGGPGRLRILRQWHGMPPLHRSGASGYLQRSAVGWLPAVEDSDLLTPRTNLPFVIDGHWNSSGIMVQNWWIWNGSGFNIDCSHGRKNRSYAFPRSSGLNAEFHCWCKEDFLSSLFPYSVMLVAVLSIVHISRQLRDQICFLCILFLSFWMFNLGPERIAKSSWIFCNLTSFLLTYPVSPCLPNLDHDHLSFWSWAVLQQPTIW